ncbi:MULTISPECIES: hypothetical protein [Paracoccus]|uniref:hypothetical protein n=1 Tax=Paracoccus TaxID=265 RepID=UPI001E349E79|nr:MULTISPECIES: hypothetical protein [Paracoccus]MDK8872074.1 hypothetical protein [Paracoccus sp. SSJ]UFS64026.1 hypothetical protein LO749_07550 [Paracoccus denitrificans]
MTCATCAAIPRPPRRAATRAPHLCRGRGGRGCRCHVAARPHLARPVLAGDGHPLRWRREPGDGPQPGQILHHPPQYPQAPPIPV